MNPNITACLRRCSSIDSLMLQTLTNVLARHVSKRWSCRCTAVYLQTSAIALCRDSCFFIFFCTARNIWGLFPFVVRGVAPERKPLPLALPPLQSLSNQIRQIAGVCSVVVSSCPSILRYKWICLPLNLQRVSISGSIAGTYWTQPKFSKVLSQRWNTARLKQIQRFGYWGVFGLLLASIRISGTLGGGFKKTTKENKEGLGAIKTHSHLSSTTLCTRHVSPRWHCSGRSSFFFFFFLSHMEAQPCIGAINHLGSCDVDVKGLFFISHRMIQISLLSNKWLPPATSSEEGMNSVWGSAERNYDFCRAGSRQSLWRWHLAPNSIFHVMTPLPVFYLPHYFLYVGKKDFGLPQPLICYHFLWIFTSWIWPPSTKSTPP